MVMTDQKKQTELKDSSVETPTETPKEKSAKTPAKKVTTKKPPPKKPTPKKEEVPNAPEAKEESTTPKLDVPKTPKVCIDLPEELATYQGHLNKALAALCRVNPGVTDKEIAAGHQMLWRSLSNLFTMYQAHSPDVLSQLLQVIFDNQSRYFSPKTSKAHLSGPNGAFKPPIAQDYSMVMEILQATCQGNKRSNAAKAIGWDAVEQSLNTPQGKAIVQGLRIFYRQN